MPHEIQYPLDGWNSFTITLNSLPASGGSNSRQSTLVTNSTNRPNALIFPRLQSGTAPTAGTIYEIFLLRGDGTNRTDNAGASDANLTIVNAQLIGSLANPGSLNTFFADIFDTAPLGKLGTEFGIDVRNSTNQNLNAASNTAKYNLLLPSIQ